MLLLQYIVFTLKQLTRIRMAFFFTMIFPVVLYSFFRDPQQNFFLIAYFNFSMQSAMLQTVGIFASAHKNTAWGNYVTTLPAPSLYNTIGTMLALLMVGIIGVVMISLIDCSFYHSLSLGTIALGLIAAIVGAIPAGCMGYFIGTTFEPIVSRNVLLLVNLFFMFSSFAAMHVQKILAWFFFPNTWMFFSYELSFNKHFNGYYFVILMLYATLFLVLTHKASVFQRRYL